MHIPVFSLNIDGTAVTSNFDPVLISLTIVDSDGGKADRLSCELDDDDGHIELPRIGAKVQAGLGWSDSGSAVIFTGFVDEVLSLGSRASGRLLTIEAKSVNTRGKLKQPAQRHMDNAAFSDVARQWGMKAGLSDVKVDSALGAINRAYWYMGHESYLAWGERIARELGATFKVMGDVGVFVSRGGAQSTSGKPLTTINAIYSNDVATSNLIHWSLAPVLSRPEYANFKTRWYDPANAQWMLESLKAGYSDTSDGGVNADLWHKRKHANPGNANKQAASDGAESDRDRGGGSATIQGNPDAASQAPCVISGARPGVDGPYRIATATHRLTRPGSYVTELALVQPSGAVGADNRATPGGS